ncbi:hypothetical protein LZ480_10335 [Solibacillus sp. MA9]|uniref:Uncharacterized protein n=1 Tax=Solibacillus palustris TaxID=2908203 RepID=A0ABS9UDF5_9BACL|nr:hypothetical protein [Solibacillus sp. MA9]MCH7322288.1 hypothetical protein [Solibacillus sp. MA9]
MLWRNINIHIDEPIKVGATEDDVFNLLRNLDLSNFIELHDAAAILTMFQTGIR